MSPILGIDIGTSKVAAVLVESTTCALIDAATAPSVSEISSKPGRAEQNPLKILEVVERCILALPAQERSEVRAIGLTGQMHGIVRWNTANFDASPLITWQDQRGLEDNFLSVLNERYGSRLKTGFGMSSLAWLARYEAEALEPYSAASTIHDYVAARFVNLQSATIDPTDAASLGLFDLESGSFDAALINRLGIPARLVPQVRPTGAVLGSLTAEWGKRLGLPAGIPVVNPIGDNQASMLATLANPATDVGLTIGTGAQVACIIDDVRPFLESTWPGLEVRPFVNGKYACVGAPLCGGSAWAWLAKTVKGWCAELGITAPSDDVLYQSLSSLGQQSSDNGLSIIPSFLGERHDVSLRGSVAGISLENFSLGNVASALAEGIVLNLRNMLPREVYHGRTKIIGSGNGLRRSPLLQEKVKQIFDLPLILTDAREEAAQGAARLAIQ